MNSTEQTITKWVFECLYDGMARSYKSRGAALRAAQLHGKSVAAKDNSMSVDVWVYEIRWNPYKKTKIAEYQY